MTNPRRKGQGGEREFARIVEEFLPEVRLERGDQSRGGHSCPDLVGLVGWWPEVKRTERPTLGTWWAKITGDIARARSTDKPLIAWRPNRGEWLTILRARDLLWLFRWCEDMARAVEKAEATAHRLAGRELELLAEIDALKNPKPYEEDK